jgi:hypothetical protein
LKDSISAIGTFLPDRGTSCHLTSSTSSYAISAISVLMSAISCLRDQMAGPCGATSATIKNRSSHTQAEKRKQ